MALSLSVILRAATMTSHYQVKHRTSFLAENARFILCPAKTENKTVITFMGVDKSRFVSDAVYAIIRTHPYLFWNIRTQEPVIFFFLKPGASAAWEQRRLI